MRYRISRHVFSALVLGTFVILAAGTSYPEKIELGDRALALHVHEDQAYLLSYSTGPFSKEASQEGVLTFSAIGRDGAVRTLQDGGVPALNRWFNAAAITATSEAAVGYLVSSTDGRTFAAAAMEPWSSPQVSWVRDDRNSPHVDLARLSMIKRDTGHYWVYYSQADVEAGDPILPLLELQDGVTTMLADDVIWAGCAGSLCQQLRYEDSTLRLFTNADDYAQPVTEIETEVYAYTSGTVDGIPMVDIGRLYALSTTQPSLKEVDEPDGMARRELRRYQSPFSNHFADGGRIEVFRKIQRSPGRRFCDRDCRKTHDVFELHVHIYDAEGNLETALVMNDYEASFLGF